MVDRELKTCRGCGTPLYTKRGDIIRVRKNQGRSTVEVSVDLSNMNGAVPFGCSNCPHLTPNYYITLKPTATSTLAR